MSGGGGTVFEAGGLRVLDPRAMEWEHPGIPGTYLHEECAARETVVIRG